LPERPALARRVAAEALAAFALVFCVGGAAAEEASGHAVLGLPAQAAVSGLAIMGLIYAVGHLSGAHINPAVTIAFTLTRHFPRREALGYIAAQLTGAALAGLLLLAIWPDTPGNLGANAIGVEAGSALAVEIVLSALLMFVIMAVATDTRAVGEAAAIAIGATVGLDAMFGGPVTGASMNPARSLGPALVAGDLTSLWVYLLAPAGGACVAAVTYQFLRDEETA
jgi:MIP family channel proteins